MTEVDAADPMAVATDWLPHNDDPDRPQVTLSTVTADGGPDARTVLLSAVDDRGFSFHTDALSRKAVELAADPRVALTVLWPGFTRQLVVLGLAEPAPVDEVAAAYAARSPYLQQLAWLNTAEFARLPLALRVERWAAFAAEHPRGFPQPPTWAGFLVRPQRLTFWTSSAEAASRRTEYHLRDGSWALEYLPG